MIFLWAFMVLFFVLLIVAVGATALWESIKLLRELWGNSKQGDFASNGWCKELQQETKQP